MRSAMYVYVSCTSSALLRLSSLCLSYVVTVTVADVVVVVCVASALELSSCSPPEKPFKIHLCTFQY